MPASGKHNGWRYDNAGRLQALFGGVEVFDMDGDDLAVAFATTIALGTTVTAGGVTVTAGGATVTAGNLTTTAGDERVTAGNLRLGAVAAFSTEPTSWAVFKQGTDPVGAITTSTGVGSNATVVRKVIADGTNSNVQA